METSASGQNRTSHMIQGHMQEPGWPLKITGNTFLLLCWGLMVENILPLLPIKMAE